MALMATADCYEKEDLAGKVIPSMSICLVDREKCAHALPVSLAASLLTTSTFRRAVRDQGYKAIDMFVRKCEALTANMVSRARRILGRA